LGNALSRRGTPYPPTGEPIPQDERRREVLDGIRAVVWEALGPSRRFLFVAGDAERLVGYPADRWLEDPDFWPDLIHPDDRQRTMEAALASVAESRDHELEYRAVARDGRVVWLRDVVAVGGLNGEATVQRGVTVDVSRDKEAVAVQAGFTSALMASMQEGLLLLDLQGNILDCNPSFCRMTGFAREELVGGRMPRPEWPERGVERLGSTIEGHLAEGFGQYEVTLKRKDGALIYVLASSSALPDGDGLVTSHAVLVHDVTERHRTEEALRESEERYRRLVELSPDAIAVHSNGVLVYANPAAVELLGADRPDQLVGTPLMDIVHPDYHDVVAERARQEIDEGKAVLPLEEVFVRLDGTFVDVEVTGIPMNWQGRPAGQVMVRDITKRKRVEQQVREAETRYRMLVEQLPAVVYIDSVVGAAESIYVSPQIEEVLGFTPLEWLTDPDLWERQLHPDDREREIRAAIAHHEKAEPYRGEYRMYTREGHLRWFLDEAVVVTDEQGRPQFCQGVMFDVTEMKRVEEDRMRAEGERHAAEAKYQALVEHIPAVFFVDQLDEEMTTVYVSPQIEAVLGLTPEEYISRPGVWLEHLHEADRDRAREVYLRGRERGGSFNYEYRMVRPDGRTIWINETAVVLRDETGRPAFIQGVMFDVTEGKRVERELRHQNEVLASLHDTALGLINRLDPDDLLEAIVSRAGALVGTPHGYIYLADPAGEEMVVTVGTGVFRSFLGFRLRPGEGLGGTVWQTGESLRIDDYDDWPNRSSAFPRGVFHAVTSVPLTSGGKVVGVLGLTHVETGKAFTDDDMKLLQHFAEVASIALDNAQLYEAAQVEILERKAAESTLRFQAQLLSMVQNAVIATDATGAVTYWNDFAESLYGWPAHEALGQNIVDLVVPRDRPGARFEGLAKALRGERWSSELGQRRKDDSTFIALVTVSPIYDEEGVLVGTIGVSIDVTEREHAEQALVAAFEGEKEISHQLRALDDMKNTFLHAVSHELRTPLATVLGFALTLERQDANLSPEDTQDIVRRLASNARKLDQLLSDLLDVDRLARGIVEPRRHPTDIGALVRRVVEGSDILGERPIRVDADLVVVAVDGPKVERIVENLLANAARHTPPGTTVRVRVRGQDGGVLIAVEDEGPGIPEALRESIFEPFRQGPDRSAHTPGVGVGLSLVIKFAELHGGRAWVEEREGGGASFRVFLPEVRA
jgi:PAS domain S-box-containing protein